MTYVAVADRSRNGVLTATLDVANKSENRTAVRAPARPWTVRGGAEMHWQVDDVMTREVITVGVDTPVGQIASLLDREDISAVPVTAATGGVLGVVSQA